MVPGPGNPQKIQDICTNLQVSIGSLNFETKQHDFLAKVWLGKLPVWFLSGHVSEPAFPPIPKPHRFVPYTADCGVQTRCDFTNHFYWYKGNSSGSWLFSELERTSVPMDSSPLHHSAVGFCTQQSLFFFPWLDCIMCRLASSVYIDWWGCVLS